MPGQLFQLRTILESVGHLLAQHAVCVVDGVEGDGPQLVWVDLPVLIQHGLVGTDVDDLTHQAAGLRVVAHQTAFHCHGKLINEGSIHKFRLGGVRQPTFATLSATLLPDSMPT